MKGWQFTFEAPAGERVLSGGFIGINCGWGDPNMPADETMWWDSTNRRWIADRDFPWGKNNPERTFNASSSAPCRSFKAFRRHLRKHADKLAGKRVVLVSRFIGHDIVAEQVPA